MSLPEPALLLLSDVVRHVASVFSIAAEDATERLDLAFRDRRLIPVGADNQPVDIGAGAVIDWDQNSIEWAVPPGPGDNPYPSTVDVRVDGLDLDRWLNEEAAARSNAIKREVSARLFAELFWPPQRVIRWIAFRDPAKIEQSLRAAKLYKATGTDFREPRPEATLLHALLSGSLEAIREGKGLPSEYWAGATERTWPEVHFRRKDVFALWPESTLARSDDLWVDEETKRRERRRWENWRTCWMDRFAERQRRKGSFISFVWIADWFARGARTIPEEADQKALAYRRLAEAAWRGEFEKAGRSRVLILEPQLPYTVSDDPRYDAGLSARRLAPGIKFGHLPHRLTLARLKNEWENCGQDFGPEAQWVTGCLRYCWLPQDLCRAWFESRDQLWPKHFDPTVCEGAEPIAVAVPSVEAEVAAPVSEADRVNPISGRSRGPRPKKLEAAKEAMRADIRTGRLTVGRLGEMLEKELTATYDVSRDTARKARDAVMSEFVEDPNFDK